MTNKFVLLGSWSVLSICVRVFVFVVAAAVAIVVVAVGREIEKGFIHDNQLEIISTVVVAVVGSHSTANTSGDPIRSIHQFNDDNNNTVDLECMW